MIRLGRAVLGRLHDDVAALVLGNSSMGGRADLDFAGVLARVCGGQAAGAAEVVI